VCERGTQLQFVCEMTEHPVFSSKGCNAGGTPACAVALTQQEMRATNTFADPDEVKPAAHAVRVVADALELSLPKQAIILVERDIS
jgi:alpha-L-arabinofuranosidase